jgi:hypothetical protein
VEDHVSLARFVPARRGALTAVVGQSISDGNEAGDTNTQWENMQQGWTYVVLCLLVPLVWGIASARLFDWWQARLRRTKQPALGPESAATRDEAAEGMYYI